MCGPALSFATRLALLTAEVTVHPINGTDRSASNMRAGLTQTPYDLLRVARTDAQSYMVLYREKVMPNIDADYDEYKNTSKDEKQMSYLVFINKRAREMLADESEEIKEAVRNARSAHLIDNYEGDDENDEDVSDAERKRRARRKRKRERQEVGA